MADKDEIIGGIMAMIIWCWHQQEVAYDGDCPVYKDQERILRGAMELLKEQEAVEPLFNERMKHFVCPNCSLVLDEGRDDYCPSCGKRIAWAEYYIHEDKTEGRLNRNENP